MAQDKRYKYRRKETAQFYIFQRNRIYYVRYKEINKTVSTGKTNYNDACIFAHLFFNTLKIEQISTKNSIQKHDSNNKNILLKDVLQSYYVNGSLYSEYDIKHGSRYNSKILQKNHYRIMQIAKHLTDVQYPKDLTRKRLIVLQEQLLNDGLSGKTVNDYMSTFHKIYKQLADKEIIKDDPFIKLRPCAHTKEIRLCFNIEDMEGIFRECNSVNETLAFIGCCTGMRRSEIERIEKEDIVLKNGQYWLKVRGTKSQYSVREVPIFQKLKTAIESVIGSHWINQNFKRAVKEVAQKMGYDETYIAENGIKFHGYRKLYKTILTQSNLNTTLVETLMGHTTQNQMSNDVERIYFVSEKADLSEIHKLVVEKLKYLV